MHTYGVIKSGIMATFSVRRQAFTIGIIMFFAALWFGSSVATKRSWLKQLISAIATFSCGVLAIVSFHLATQICPYGISLQEFTKLYFYEIRLMIIAKQHLTKFRDDTKIPREVQQNTLIKILKRNAGTEYGRKMDLGNVRTIDEFRQRHPLSDYKQFEEYIERTANGEDNVIIPNRPFQLSLTSGTTGKPKMIPCSIERRMHDHFTAPPRSLNAGVMRETGCHAMYLTQKEGSLYTHPAVYKSEAGIVMSIDTRLTRKDWVSRLASPPAAYEITSDREAMYIHAIFLLKDETLRAINTSFCTNLAHFFQELETNWRSIVHDISTGTIKADLDIPTHVRNELCVVLKPDPIRAEQLRRAFEHGFEGIAKRVWPYLMHMHSIVPKSFQLSADVVENKYAKGVVLYSPYYVSTEGFHAVNLWPEKREKQYLFFTELEFLEFIPLSKSDDDEPETLLIDELKEGESYELVITNCDGLYRFRFGDVIKVVGFYNKSPIIEFRFRIGDIINLRGERTTEDSLRQAIFDTVASWEVELVEYSCAEYHMLEDAEGATESAAEPYYVIFMEINIKSGSQDREKVDTLVFDNLLRKSAPMYDEERIMQTIGPAKVILVQPGSFKKLQNYILENSTSGINQFKMPRKLRRKEWIQILLNADL